jgi:GNAT superfamily N-acetyltransferase
MRKRIPFHTLLVFPPVWSPVTPYLALPALAAYLRKEGLSTRQYDASLDFFTEHLLTKSTMSSLLDVVSDRHRKGHYEAASSLYKGLLSDSMENRDVWQDKIADVKRFLDTLRHETFFYDPERCIRAQNSLYDCLRLASLSYFPTIFTFNTFSNDTVSGFPEMIRFCEDRASNPFLEFFTTRLPEIMEKEQPGLIGISVSTSHQLMGAFTLSRLIIKNYPAIHVTLGGRHVLRLQESFMHQPHFLPEFCHSLILDNGERPLKSLIAHLSTGASLTRVPNLAHFQKDRLILNEMGPHEPISELPVPDFSDLSLRDYLTPVPILPIRLSEGCYWGKCTFCSRYDNKKFQTIPPDQAVEHMEELQNRYDVSCFTVNDDCLTPPYLEAFSKAIIRKGARFQISLWCKPVGSFTLDRLQLLSKAGVRLIRWGVETGHPRILKIMNKGTRLEDTLSVLKDASEAGIWNHATMILGYPTETIDEAKETIRFLEKNTHVIHSSILFRFVLLKHSYIIQHPEEFKIESTSRAEDSFSYEYNFTCSDGMDENSLSSLLAWAQKYRIEQIYGHPFWYYLRIREYLLPYLKRCHTADVLKWKVNPRDLSIYGRGTRIDYFFQYPQEIPLQTLNKIQRLIELAGEVGRSWIRGNLKSAFLIGYAEEQGRIVGTMSLKRPLQKYVRELEAKTHLDLQGYLERGYSAVRPEYRALGIGDRLLKGLAMKASGEKIYVTIRLDNEPAVRLTRQNHMRLAGTFFNERTGNQIGLFTNR